MISSASSRSNKSNKGADEKRTKSPSVFPEKEDERPSGFSMNNLSYSLSDDGLTFSVSYEWSIMDASVDEDKHAKSWMAGSPKMSGRNRGDSDGRELSFGECWCLGSHSYSSWMILHVGCATATSSVACSLLLGTRSPKDSFGAKSPCFRSIL